LDFAFRREDLSDFRVEDAVFEVRVYQLDHRQRHVAGVELVNKPIVPESIEGFGHVEKNRAS
jgi:hypothetical protein